MKRCRWIKVVLVCRSLASSGSHLCVVKCNECRRKMLCRTRLLLNAAAKKSIRRRSVENLIMQVVVIRRIHLFTERSFLGHFFFFDKIFFHFSNSNHSRSRLVLQRVLFKEICAAWNSLKKTRTHFEKIFLFAVTNLFISHTTQVKYF